MMGSSGMPKEILLHVTHTSRLPSDPPAKLKNVTPVLQVILSQTINFDHVALQRSGNVVYTGHAQ